MIVELTDDDIDQIRGWYHSACNESQTRATSHLGDAEATELARQQVDTLTRKLGISDDTL